MSMFYLEETNRHADLIRANEEPLGQEEDGEREPTEDDSLLSGPRCEIKPKPVYGVSTISCILGIVYVLFSFSTLLCEVC